MTHNSESRFIASVDSLAALSLAVLAVVCANTLHFPAATGSFLESRITLANALFALVFAQLWKQCFGLLGLYGRKHTSPRSIVMRSSIACALMTAAIAAYLWVRRSPAPVNEIALLFFTTSLTFEMVRIFVLVRPLQWSTTEPEHVLIVGSGPLAGRAWREIRTRQAQERVLLGFMDTRGPETMAPDMAGRFLGYLQDLPSYLLSQVVDVIVVALPARSCYEEIRTAVALAELAGVRIEYLKDFYPRTRRMRGGERAQLMELETPHAGALVAALIKRSLDVTVSVIALLLTAPILLLIALAIKTTSRGPIFYGQSRYGYRRRQFRMWKFRSMVEDADHLLHRLEAQNEASGPMFKILKDPRVTPIGRFLRSTSLDELPQFWNVLKGDMSLVGPRPMSVRDVKLFSEAQLLRRFSARPGITGLWQVTERASLKFERWIALDFAYIDNWSLLLDLKILAQTVPAVLKRSGA